MSSTENRKIVSVLKRRLSFFIVLIILLVFTNIFTLILSVRSQQQIIDNYSNPYPLIDIARNFVKKENFIVNIQPLREYLYTLVEENVPNLISVYFEVLNTGANISINPNERFWPASLSKVPAAMAVLKKVESGEWKLSNELVLFEEDKDSRYGELHKNPVGTRFTIEALIKELLINSDNTAFKIFVRNLSAESFEDVITSLGLEDLYNEDYDISAKEFSRIFRALYNSSFLNREYSQMLLEWLSESNFEEFLGSAIPDTEIFSHKIGEQEEQNVFLDSGIVYLPERAYLITVLMKINETDTNTTAKDKSEELMFQISNKAYEYIKNF